MQNTVFRVILLIIFLAVFSKCQKNETPAPLPPEESIYQNCVPELTSTTFDIVTWNIEHYPSTGFQVEQVVDIIITLNADLIALQEIENKTAFDELLALLPGWSGEISVTGTLNLAYIYKTEEVSMGEVSELFLGMYQPFPRAPALTTASHINGLSVTLINNHLKCCGGTDNIDRRKEASALLKEYVDTNLPDDEVLILGDLNDIIYSEAGEPITFQNFLDDPDNYEFADMGIAMSEPEWSYPDWPSHIDHILVTNELFDNISSTETLILDNCQSGYITAVSDHRPVLIRLTK